MRLAERQKLGRSFRHASKQVGDGTGKIMQDLYRVEVNNGSLANGRVEQTG